MCPEDVVIDATFDSRQATNNVSWPTGEQPSQGEFLSRNVVEMVCTRAPFAVIDFHFPMPRW